MVLMTIACDWVTVKWWCGRVFLLVFRENKTTNNPQKKTKTKQKPTDRKSIKRIVWKKKGAWWKAFFISTAV